MLADTRAALRRAGSGFVAAVVVLVPLGLLAQSAFDEAPPDPDRLAHGVGRGLVTGGIVAVVLAAVRLVPGRAASPLDTAGVLAGSVLAFMSAPPTWAAVLVTMGVVVTLVATRYRPGSDPWGDAGITALAAWFVVGWIARHGGDAVFAAFCAAVVVAGAAVLAEPGRGEGAESSADGRWLLHAIAAALLVPLAVLFSLALLAPLGGRRDPSDGAGALLVVSLAVLAALDVAVLRGLRRRTPRVEPRSVVGGRSAVG